VVRCHHRAELLQLLSSCRDAGIALACTTSSLDRNEDHTLRKGLSRSKDTGRYRILELGAGCGIVGIAIAQVLTETDVILTDLPEAQEIVERNISRAHLAKESTLAFQVLDWDVELPANLQTPSSSLDLVIAADCTYNSDSR
jgi:methylase of polypeptide subunit release factors